MVFSFIVFPHFDLITYYLKKKNIHSILLRCLFLLFEVRAYHNFMFTLGFILSRHIRFFVTATEGCRSLISSRKIKVTLLSCEWGSTKGGLSTINRELAIQLAKNDNVEVSMYLPLCSEEDEIATAEFRVCLLKEKRKPGYDPIDWLASIPRDHRVDFVIAHGIDLGRQIPMIREFYIDCKWIQVVDTNPEELGMLKDYAGPTVQGEKKHQAEVELCKLAD